MLTDPQKKNIFSIYHSLADTFTPEQHFGLFWVMDTLMQYGSITTAEILYRETSAKVRDLRKENLL